MSCIETLLNQAYERNAVLESEVDEIENLRVKLQRATDEARGMHFEVICIFNFMKWTLTTEYTNLRRSIQYVCVLFKLQNIHTRA